MATSEIGRLIQGPDDLEIGMQALILAEPKFKTIYAETGPLPLRLRPDGFAAVLQIIVGQQVSVASAAAIWQRLEDAECTTALAISAASDEDFAALGFSRQKVKYARALADAGLDYAAFRHHPTDQVQKQLLALPGIGPWTAEIYCMFCLCRADVFAPGDLALQESAKLIFDLPTRPTAKELATLATKWSPWSAVAARLLWAYYRVAKNREGIT